MTLIYFQSTGRQKEIDNTRILYQKLSLYTNKSLKFITKDTYIYLYIELNLVKKEILEFLKSLGLTSLHHIEDFHISKPKDLEVKAREEIYCIKTGYTNPSLVPEIVKKISMGIKKAFQNDPTIVKRRYETLGKEGKKKATQKSLKTKRERYGDSNYNNREKAKETIFRNYGVGNPSQAQEIKDLKKASLLKHYNVKSVFGLPEVRKKISLTNLQRYGVTQPLLSVEIQRKIKETFKKKSLEEKKNIYEKVFKTKKERKNLNTSKGENKIFSLLIQKFPDTLTQYKSSVYPYSCDFYIPSLDVYIEYQGSWTHGNHPYDENNPEDLKTLEKWKEKSKEINFRGQKKLFYLNAIKVWSIKDVEKREIACKNKLKYLEFFNEKEFLDWFNKI